MSKSAARKPTLSDVSSTSSLDVARLNESLRGYHQPSHSCMSWLVPLLIAVGVGLLVYLIYNYSCGYKSSNSNSNSNSNNSNGVLVISNMANNSNSGQVVDLDGDKLDSISSNEPVVVAFLAQGCGWCTKVKPNYVETAKVSPKQLYSLYAHSKNGMESCKRYGVKGFPTIMYIHKGKVVSEYSGDRSPQDLLRWIKSLQQ
jgi:thiol-disulfide isomerase/thioredoxin